MLLSEYLNFNDEFDRNGIFDPVLDEDSHFFINLQRLKKTEIPEFIHSYDKIHDYFRQIIKLLDRAEAKSSSDTYYKQALKRFDFGEVNGICLGYAKGVIGSGFGAKLANQVMSTAYDIVKAGVVDPEFFELLPLFQDNVGADRLSDMIATLILPDIEQYTLRINKELGIDEKSYPNYRFRNGFLINPKKNSILYLIPIDILHKLPVARSWEDIDFVVSENSTLRSEMNIEVANEWNKYTTEDRKSFLRRYVFENPEVCNRVIKEYKAETLDEFNPNCDFDYLLNRLLPVFKQMVYKIETEDTLRDSHETALAIIDVFKHWVEYNDGAIIIGDSQTGSREKHVQRILHLCAIAFTEANNLDFSCEPNEGRGPVDFKISRGLDRTIIELKLSSNSQCKHGYETQIIEYGKAENTSKRIYLLIDVGNPGRVKFLQDLHDRKIDEGVPTPDLIIIDAKEKKSASRA